MSQTLHESPWPCCPWPCCNCCCCCCISRSCSCMSTKLMPEAGVNELSGTFAILQSRFDAASRAFLTSMFDVSTCVFEPWFCCCRSDIFILIQLGCPSCQLYTHVPSLIEYTTASGVSALVLNFWPFMRLSTLMLSFT